MPLGEHWRPEVIEAKEKELDNWNKFEVFKEVKDEGQKTISTRWVITEKEKKKRKVHQGQTCRERIPGRTINTNRFPHCSQIHP